MKVILLEDVKSLGKKGEVVNVSYELPKSCVVCEKQGKTVVYITQLSTKTLLSRTESSTSTHKFSNM